MKLCDDSGHHIKDFRVSCIGDIAVVVYQYRLQERRNDVRIDHLKIVRFLNVAVDELQNLLLDGP